MSVTLGPFAVSAEAAEVAAFRRAARIEADTLPFTWPIRWLARPEIRAALVDLMPDGVVPFHESQTFDYAAPLQAGAAYALEVAARHESGPPERIVVEGRVVEDGATVATIETVLRLFATGRAA